MQVSKGTLDVLFEQGWIAPKGRRETPGRPVTWATTDAFLRHFGLATLNDLPGSRSCGRPVCSTRGRLSRCCATGRGRRRYGRRPLAGTARPGRPLRETASGFLR